MVAEDGCLNKTYIVLSCIYKLKSFLFTVVNFILFSAYKITIKISTIIVITTEQPIAIFTLFYRVSLYPFPLAQQQSQKP